MGLQSTSKLGAQECTKSRKLLEDSNLKKDLEINEVLFPWETSERNYGMNG